MKRQGVKNLKATTHLLEGGSLLHLSGPGVVEVVDVTEEAPQYGDPARAHLRVWAPPATKRRVEVRKS